MELNYGPEHDEYREQVRSFLRREWRGGSDVAAFRQQVIEAGYITGTILDCDGGMKLGDASGDFIIPPQC
ncbi:hypothetical protein HNR03_000239 [Pseudomonas sp. JAI111]|uniref:hypothetical protein n=1 Tax=Pseudomonas sp. JAI111 TaxID=2735913 RepID=UPI002167C168|nr:hypothetical protein [Pseudomonas sp. JAI111]MCS3835659.1 hypothetical protein [Pseudomonas sp. JAI111]